MVAADSSHADHTYLAELPSGRNNVSTLNHLLRLAISFGISERAWAPEFEDQVGL